ncbi:MAG TPA: SCO family protein [Bryobacteraceae bacterium]|nr:SCO family protein [Bryobacteraceae bacterium]
MKPVVERVFLAITLLLASCSSDPSLPSFGVVPDFKLTDQSNRAFDSKLQLDGRVWVANFIFTTCSGPCPRMTAQFKKLRDEVADDPKLRMVSFTIDPARDTPEALATYARNFGANPDKWFFLTGAQKDLHELSRNAFMLGDIDGNLEHSSRFVLVDTQSRIRGFYDSADQEGLQKLTTDLRALLKGAS